MQDGQQYRAVRLGGMKVRGLRELPEAELRRLAIDPAGLLWRSLDLPVKIDRGTVMVEAELATAGGTIHVAYKQHRPRGVWKGFCGLFRPSRAARAWRLSRALVDRAIATARPVAMCESRRLKGRLTSYLATQWIEGAENLHLWGWRLADRPLPERLRSAACCARSLGRLLGQMHAHGIGHRDLKAANLLVVDHRCVGSAGETVETFLVDVEGVRIRRRLSARRRAADLARLAAGLEAHAWVTRSVCLRFVRAYAAEFPAGTITWKALWRQVAANVRRIVARKRRRGEQVL